MLAPSKLSELGNRQNNNKQNNKSISKQRRPDQINEMNEAIETLNPNPTGNHSRAEGLTRHRKRVLRRQSRGWHEA
jgi:hypothetical protein